MGSGIRIRHAGDRRINEDDGAVARQKIAPIHPLAEKQRILIREVIIGGEELVEPSAVPREQQWRTSRLRFSTDGADPERRIGAAQQKLAGRRWRSIVRRALRAAAREADGGKHGGDASGKAGREAQHRGKYTAH